MDNQKGDEVPLDRVCVDQGGAQTDPLRVRGRGRVSLEQALREGADLVNVAAIG